MSRTITISKIGEVTQLKIVDNGKITILGANTRELEVYSDGVIILNDPNETKLNNFKIPVAELTNDGNIDFTGVVTGEDLFNKLALEKCFKNGGGLGVDEIEKLIISSQADSSGNVFKGYIKHLQNYDYRIYVEYTLINGVLDKVPYTQDITLDPADVLDRYDLPLANSNRTITALKGDPLENPIEPTDYNLETQVRIGVIYVKANSTEPTGVVNIKVFGENTGVAGGEFDAVTYNNPANIDFDSAEQSSTGALSIKYKSFVGANFTNGTTKYNGKDLSNVTFKVFLTEENKSHKLRLTAWVNNTMQVGQVFITHGQFNFDSYKIGVWQEIIISGEALNANWGEYQFDMLYLSNRERNNIFYVDDINMQFGGVAADNTTSPHPTKLSQFENDVPFIKVADMPVYTLSVIDGSNNFSLLKDGLVITTLDLTPYLDDTNLARITNGVLDPVTGVLTVSRDDATTFTIDLGALKDIIPTNVSAFTNDANYATQTYVDNAIALIPTFPAPYLEELIPDSYLPDTTGNFVLKGSYFTEQMCLAENLNNANGILIDGQVIDYATFISDNEIHVNATSGSVEGSFSVTLNNGSQTVVFNNALLIILGTVLKPVLSDWESVVNFDIEEGLLAIQGDNILASAKLKETSFTFEANTHKSIEFNYSKSPLVEYTLNDGSNYGIAFKRVSDNTLVYKIRLYSAIISAGKLYAHAWCYIDGQSKSLIQLNNTVFGNDINSFHFKCTRDINNNFSFFVNGVLKSTLTHQESEDLYIDTTMIDIDTDNIKLITYQV